MFVCFQIIQIIREFIQDGSSSKLQRLSSIFCYEFPLYHKPLYCPPSGWLYSLQLILCAKVLNQYNPLVVQNVYSLDDSLSISKWKKLLCVYRAKNRSLPCNLSSIGVGIGNSAIMTAFAIGLVSSKCKS